MSEYTPTTNEVRNAWWRDQCPKGDLDFDDIYNAAFDRWLAAHDADAWEEGAKWAAVECGAIETEDSAWLAPGDNPYRAGETDE